MQIKTLRSLKKRFIQWRLHKISGRSEGFLSQLIWMSRLSRWVSENKNVAINDFPSEWNYEKRYELYERVLSEENLDGPVQYLEFGVANGDSFRWWVHNNNQPGSRFDGFDTFTGLPEDFGQFKKGTFNTGNAVPEINDSRCAFHAGLFQQTLPPFLEKFDHTMKLVIMLDADLYSSTLFVLTSLAPYLKEGDIIFFDEFGVPTHEFMAYQNFIDSYYVKLELIGAANNYYFAAFKVSN